MNKDFLKTIFHSDVGRVYEYTGTIPAGMDVASTEMCAHVTNDFVTANDDNLVSTMVVHLPQYNNKIVLFCNDSNDVNTSEEFVLLTDLVPDPIIEPVIEETPSEETTVEQTPEEGQ